MGRNWAQGGVHWCGGGGQGGAVSVFGGFGLVVGGGGRYRCLVDSLLNLPANV